MNTYFSSTFNKHHLSVLTLFLIVTISIPSFAKADAIMDYYERHCSNNAGWACNKLAAHYDQLPTNKSNRSKAAELYKKACDLGYTAACYNLAVMIDSNHSPFPKSKAISYYQKACDSGLCVSCKKELLIN